MIFRSGDNPDASPGYEGVNTMRRDRLITGICEVHLALSANVHWTHFGHDGTISTSAEQLNSKASRENGIHWKIIVERALNPSITFLLFGDAKNFLSHPI